MWTIEISNPPEGMNKNQSFYNEEHLINEFIKPLTSVMIKNADLSDDELTFEHMDSTEEDPKICICKINKS